MIKKLFGGKSNEFFLELDETSDNQATETKVAEKKPEPAAAPVEKQPEPVAVAPEEKPTEVVATQPTTKNKKTSIKNGKKKATKTAATSASTSTPISSKSTNYGGQPSWIQVMYNTSSSNGNGNGQVKVEEQTFATDNLLPTPSTYRRRPGPSLNKFKDMARQAKTPRR